MIAKSGRATQTTYRNLDKAPLPVIILRGTKLKFSYANDLARAFFALPFKECLGKPVGEVFGDLLPEHASRSLYRHCILNEHSVVLEKRLLALPVDKLSEKAVLFNITCSPFFNDKGKASSIALFFSECFEKKPVEPREQQLFAFFRHAPIGIVCYRGYDFIVEMANDKALEMWGKRIEEVKGRSIGEIFPEVKTDPFIAKIHDESVEKLRRGETHVVNEVELKFTRSGKVETGWYNYIHEPYTDPAGHIEGIMAIAIDVTDQVKSRKRLQIITDGLPALVAYINAQERYEFVNKAYESWFNLKREEIIDRSILEVIGPLAYEKVRPHVAKALSGEVDTFAGWVPYRNESRYISASYIPHFSSNGQVLGYFGLVNDLTDLKKNQDALLDHEERLNLLTRAVNAGTFDHDLATGKVYWSDELRSLLGIGKDEIVTEETGWSIVHPEDRKMLLESTDMLRKFPSETLSTDARIIRRDNGEVRWIHSRLKVITGESDANQSKRIIGFAFDITDRKRIEEQLKQFNASLEAEVRQRTDDLTRANRILSEANHQLLRTHSFLQQLIDSSVEIIAVVDTSLRYIAVNSTFERKLNLDARNVLGKSVTEVFPSAHGTDQVANIRRALEGEVVRAKTYRSVVDSEMFVDTHFLPLREDEKVVGVIMMVRDVTDVVKKEQELEKVNRQLADAQHLTKLGSWEWDVASGNVVWSDEMYRIYGYDEKFPVDFVRATERMTPEHAERSSRRTQQFITEALEKFKITKELFFEIPPIEFPITLPDGTTKTLRSSGRIQLREDGTLYRLAGAIQDVTQIRSAEEKLHTLIAELERKNKELESFSYVASHDLQEPLRKIQTFADRIMSQSLSPEQLRDYLERMNKSAKRMAELISSMLMLSRVSNTEGDVGDVNLNLILENCKSDLEVRIRETSAVIEADHLPTIKAAGFQMTQLFSNLIGNAIKFSEKTPRITIRCAMARGREIPGSNANPDGNFWCLRFRDNGIGFDTQFKSVIFEPFHRLHGRHEFSGTGIGLSIVKKIVQRHNGHIDVTSAPGEGTEFIIWLPS